MKRSVPAVAAALTATLYAAYASAQATPTPAPFDRRMETWPVAGLMGLSEVQLREKLGVTPSPHAYLSKVERTDDGELRVLRLRDLVFPGDNCGEEATIQVALRHGGKTSFEPVFQFTDGKLAEILNHVGDPSGQLATLSRSCIRVAPGMTPGETALYIAVFSPAVALVAPQVASDAMQESAGKAALEDLRLGEEPPGGLAAYVKRLPSAVSAGRVVEGRQEMTILFRKASKYRTARTVRVLLQDGRVTGFEKDQSNRSPCALMAAGELRCDMPSLRKVRRYPPT